MTKKVVVVGAGICGLTVAYRLKEAGYEVSVLEKQDYCGGRTKSIEEEGFVIDLGASLMPSSYKEFLALSREVGLGDEIESVPSASASYIDGKFYPLAMDKPAKDFLFAPYLSIGSKLSFARMLPSVIKQWSSLGFDDLSEAASSDVQTAKEFCLRYLTEEAYDKLINPLLRGMYIANGDSVSATQLLWILRNFSGVEIFGFKGGMQSLANRLAELVPVSCGVSIDSVDEGPDGVQLIGTQGGEAVSFDADLCVLATDGKDLKTIHGSKLTEKQNGFLSALCYSPIKMVTYMTEQRPELEAVLVMPTERDEPDLALIVLDHLYGESRTPEGRGMISFLAMHGTQEKWVDDTEHVELMKLGNKWLHKYFPKEAESVMHVNTRYWPRASTVGVPGIYRKLKEFVDDTDPSSKVYFTGDYRVASSVGVAVSTANQMAKNIITKQSG